MFAIRESHQGRIATGRSADLHGGEWWTGRRWSPASNEAKEFEDREAADREVAECNRGATVVTID